MLKAMPNSRINGFFTKKKSVAVGLHFLKNQGH